MSEAETKAIVAMKAAIAAIESLQRENALLEKARDHHQAKFAEYFAKCRRLEEMLDSLRESGFCILGSIQDGDDRQFFKDELAASHRENKGDE